MSIVRRLDRIVDMMESLIQSQERYEAFLDASPWGILVTDTNFKIVYANNRLLLMTGYRLEDILDKSVQFLMPEEDRKLHLGHEKTYRKNPVVRIGNHGLHPKILRKDGSIFPVEVSISPGNVSGEQFFFASIRILETLKNTV